MAFFDKLWNKGKSNKKAEGAAESVELKEADKAEEIDKVEEKALEIEKSVEETVSEIAEETIILTETKDEVSVETEQEAHKELQQETQQELQQETQKNEEESDTELSEVINSIVIVDVSSDQMQAYVTVFPPQNGGRDIDALKLREVLMQKGIVFGIDEALFNDIVMKKLYNEKLLIAVGTPKVDGKDAIIDEFFPHEQEVIPYEKEDGTVDFKTLNIIRELNMGTLVAKKIPATAGSNGTTVTGKTLVPREGKDKSIVVGENMRLSENEEELYTAVKGNLVYKGGKFAVETIFTVDGNVDNTIGNITFCGDIVVKGDLLEGYKIDAKGLVHVRGGVQGGKIIAGGDIIVDGGFNGMSDGELSSQGDIKAKFLQNGRVSASGNIESEAVINSFVNCDGDLLVTRGKGVIVGGRCNVLHRVEANVIGSEINAPTQINIGVPSELIKEKNKLIKEVDDIVANNELIEKNIKYVNYVIEKGEKSPKYKEQLNVCNRQKIKNMVNLSKNSKRLDEIQEIIDKSSIGSQVKANKFYPQTKLTFSDIAEIIRQEQLRLIYRLQDGEIVTSVF